MVLNCCSRRARSSSRSRSACWSFSSDAAAAAAAAARTLCFGLGGLLLLESGCLGLLFLALGLVTCAKCFGGVSFGADCLSLCGGFAIRSRPGFGVNALCFYAL